MAVDPLAEIEGFDWDDGNIGKNWPTHGVTDWECEEIFFNKPLVIAGDWRHSQTETRHYALGQTDRGRLLFVAFTVRRHLIRPISCRDMTARERKAYENAKEDTDVQG
ncbi:MAG TPA: BrnT family toxin [Thermoanaerobaculia bacterium]